MVEALATIVAMFLLLGTVCLKLLLEFRQLARLIILVIRG
jgi:hypothetical protein